MLLFTACKQFMVVFECKTKIIFTFIFYLMANSIASLLTLNRVQIAIFMAVSVLVLMRPMEYLPDSLGYFDMHIIRSPGYPLFVGLIKMVSFGFFDLILKLAQLIIGLFAVRFFICKLRSSIKLGRIWYILLTMVLLIPYVYNLNIANRLLSEALSYPLFLVVTGFYIRAYLSNSSRQLMLSLPFLLVLLITRSQFMIFIPIAILILWQLNGSRGILKKWKIVLVLLVLPFISKELDRSYHYAANGQFVKTPWTYVHLMSMAMTVSDAEDVSLFTSEAEKTYFTAVYEELARRNLHKDHLSPNKGRSLQTMYRENYSEIIIQTVVRHGLKSLRPDVTEMTPDDFVLVEATAKKMVFPLIRDNLTDWLKIYLHNLFSGFDGLRYFILYLLLIISTLVISMKNQSRPVKLLLLISVLSVGNMMVIALGPHTIKRLTFYTDWVLFLLFFLLLNELIKNAGSRSETTPSKEVQS